MDPNVSKKPRMEPLSALLKCKFEKDIKKCYSTEKEVKFLLSDKCNIGQLAIDQLRLQKN